MKQNPQSSLLINQATKNPSQKLTPKPSNVTRPRTQLHQSQRVPTYANMLVNKPQPMLTKQPSLQAPIATPAPPPIGERYASNHAFSSSALELFRTLSVLAHDETLNFQILLKAIRTALPTLRTLDNDEEKSITIFEHYYAHYNGQQI
ncbi:hypothetical protein CDAR_33881 [Caerostris darwini]|uniref:Uncharacterized protein n=1 Tax=Caerostris darwini TaxID=1538125 RepID=A0AAV4P1F1_9ARAC|nr:hypothetical protein CDAR_33881 [Caerostris darwini]